MPSQRQRLGEEVCEGLGSCVVRVEEVGKEPGARGRLDGVMGEAVLDPVENEDPVSVLFGRSEENVRIRGRRLPGVRVVCGHQAEDALAADHIEGLGDQPRVDSAVAIGVDQDQVGQTVLRLEPRRDVDRFPEAAAAAGVDGVADRVQVRDRQDHGRVADRDWCSALRIRIELRRAAVDLLAVERGLAGAMRGGRERDRKAECDKCDGSLANADHREAV